MSEAVQIFSMLSAIHVVVVLGIIIEREFNRG